MSERNSGLAGLGWLLLLASVCVLLLLFSRKLNRDGQVEHSEASASPSQGPSAVVNSTLEERWVRISNPTIQLTPEEVVAEKVSRFGGSRRKLAEALAKRKGVDVTEEIARFFSAVESGKWDDIQTTFTAIAGGDSSAGHASTRAPEVTALWPAIIDAFGVAEQAHLLPAQTLLDYGHSILDSLRPGMVYVGGTDASRWVPALLNDTSDGERHIVITQNGLADSSYLDYVRLQFDQQLNTLTDVDSKSAFEDYIEDARKRLEHDERFPDEPKQIRSAEDVKIVDGKVQVSGRVAVMSINEKLLQTLLEKNPEVSFAIGESFPLRNTYADATPLGPIMELRADAANTFTQDRAAQSLDQWRERARQILADPEKAGSTEALKIYSHDAVAAANLLAAHDFSAEAEEAYRLSSQLWPANPEAHVALAQLLSKTGRPEEGQFLLENFKRKHPDQVKHIEGVAAFLIAKP